MIKYGGLTLAILAAAGLALIVSCGDDNPVGPGTSKDYPVYFYDGANYGWFFEYFPPSNTIDSFQLPFEPAFKFSVSADGRRLYVGLDYTLAIVDLETHGIIKELPYTGAVAVSSNGRYMAVLGDGIRILRTSDLFPIFEDTLHVAYGAFSSDGMRFYCPYGNYLTEPAQILVVDLRHHRTRSIPVPSGAILTNVIPSADESRLYLWYELGSCASAFMVFDPREDSIIYYDYLTPGKGEMLLSPDGKTIFYTNPGPQFDIGCCLAPSEIYAYDIQSNTYQAISTLGLIGSPYDIWLPMGELAITPDNRWLITADNGGFEFILRFNVQRMRLDAYLDIGQPRQIFNLTCQNGR